VIERVRPRTLLLCSTLLVAVATFLISCSSGASSPTGQTPTSNTSESTAPVVPFGFRVITITVTRPDGTVEQHCVWLADDEASRERGLMGVSDSGLGGRPGMLFRFPADTTTAFWMKDTLLPLSIAWFDADGAFVSSTDMPPCPAGTGTCPSYPAARPYRLALEVPLGGLEPLGLETGSSLRAGGACAQSPGSVDVPS
jgi:hypothetical protein